MNVTGADVAVSRIAAAIGEPARARMLFSLLDGHARTSTELAAVAGVSPSTASVHLGRLKEERLVEVAVQGRHRYYRLSGATVASALEALGVLAGRPVDTFTPTTPTRLRSGRRCYDHMAGTVAVVLHDRFKALRWLTPAPAGGGAYDLTAGGEKALDALGIDLRATRALRRRFAYDCLDWSERRPHLGGALAAAILDLVLKRKWLSPDLDSRALTLTAAGRREMRTRFGVSV